MPPTAEIKMPTSKKEAVKMILQLQKETRQLENRVQNVEFTTRSFMLYENAGTASTIGLLAGTQLN
jgi:hypothetical protein